LKIVQLKEYFPKVPFLALTASATSRVKEDIVTQLKLDNPQIFTKSFYRANIAYMVFETEDKLYLLQQILQKNPEPSIIYVTNRKSCLETVHQLESQGFTATYYHGGLTAKEKEKHMKLWMEEKVQVIVATNAFGMGIDKANVKTIIHLHLPQNLENYYQEAGRAGRDGEKAFAIGNFHNKEEVIKYLQLNPNEDGYVDYRYLDKFSLIECPTCCPEQFPNQEQVNVFSNPATSNNPATIEIWLNPNTTGKLEIYDSAGRLVAEEYYSDLQNVYTFAQFASGIYHYCVSTETGFTEYGKVLVVE
jgi:superfamily II DNA helicase RecQ